MIQTPAGTFWQLSRAAAQEAADPGAVCFAFHSNGSFCLCGEKCRYLCKKGGKKEEKKDLEVFYASDVYIMIIILITCGLFVCSFLSLHQFICWFLLPGQIYLIISLCSSTSSS